MIVNKKTFYAIGQGTFYSEKIYFRNQIKTIVYDCGSLNKNRLNKEIKQSKLKTIDYLVISHFHKDHINGINELLKNKYKIVNVIIPKIEPEDILFYLKTYSAQKDHTYRNLILNPDDFFKNANDGQNSKIIIIDKNTQKTKDTISIQSYKTISHSTDLPIFKLNNQALWILRFYIDKGVFNQVILKENDKKIINSINSIESYEKHLPYLKTLYKKISNKNINLTSMSMLSAPIYSHIISHNYYNNSISIMNGDILLNTEKKISKFIEHYSNFNSYIFDFHIPHHGSHYNLKRPINEWINKQALIMSGYENNFGHPSGIILRKFSDANIQVKTLTEYDKNYSQISYFLITLNGIISHLQFKGIQ